MKVTSKPIIKKILLKEYFHYKTLVFAYGSYITWFMLTLTSHKNDSLIINGFPDN